MLEKNITEVNSDLQEIVNPEDSPMKEWMVTYVGTRFDQEDVTVEMIIDVMANEFPEFLLAIAEENWVRGYQQALEDVEMGKTLVKEENDKRKKSCRICEKTE